MGEANKTHFTQFIHTLIETARRSTAVSRFKAVSDHLYHRLLESRT